MLKDVVLEIVKELEIRAKVWETMENAHETFAVSEELFGFIRQLRRAVKKADKRGE